MERLLTWDGAIPRRKREQFRKYLEHENERVRAFAQEIAGADAVARAELRLDCELDELFSELAEEGIFLVDIDTSSLMTSERAT